MSLDNETGGSRLEIPTVAFAVPDQSRKHKALRRLRKWERNRVKYTELRRQAFSGETYARLVAKGSARPYNFADVEHTLRSVLSRNALALLGHVMAVERGFGAAKGGVVLSHATTAVLLHVSVRLAGDVARQLVEDGLLEQRPHFRVFDTQTTTLRSGDVVRRVQHQELVPCYRTTALARSLVARRDARLSRKREVGKKCHPTGNEVSPPGKRKGTPARGPGMGVTLEPPKLRTPRGYRPEQAFVSAVLRARQDATTRRRHATVIERLPDGSVALGSLLRSGDARLVEPRLQARRDVLSGKRKASDLDAIESGIVDAAFRSLEKKLAREAAAKNTHGGGDQ